MTQSQPTATKEQTTELRELTYPQAICEALHQAMDLSEEVMVMGQLVDYKSGIFGTTTGLFEKFGAARVQDMPVSEGLMTSAAMGAALTGTRPVIVHQRLDFMLYSLDAIVNWLALWHFKSDGKSSMPVTIRAITGRGWGQGFQHSKSVYSIFAHFPGLKVVIPTTPRDAKGLLTAAIRDDNPVIVIEHRWLYWQEGEVPEEPFTVPIGESNTIRRGNDLTIVATSWMNVEALQAADILARRGIGVEIIDPRTIAPFDEGPIVTSVKKTRHCIIADNDWLDYGFSAEAAARIAAQCRRELKAPIVRLGFAATPCPTARHLEDRFYAGAEDIIRTAESMLGLKPADLSAESFYNYEHKFKGPF